jgi:GDP/UDP-N,N'-diacetylbacillosamine 2-epimerase (hydrolysing)
MEDEMANPDNTPVQICVVTSSRSEYGLMRWLLADLSADPFFDLKIVVTAAHLSESYGSTYQEIEADGFTLDAKIPANAESSEPVALAKVVAEVTSGLAKYLDSQRPDLVLIMGDRYELLGICSASILCGIPIAHLSGGDISEGAIDDQVRHAVTKMANLHFVANEEHANRVRQLGEESWRVGVSGEPGLENIHRLPLLSRSELENNIGINLSRKTALVTYHPATLMIESLTEHLRALTEALENASKKYDLQFVLTYPNSDVGSDQTIAALEQFQQRLPETKLFKNLGHKRFLALLREVNIMIGNSSCGLYEAPAFNLPVVNIGDRQRGRMRGANVIDVGDCSAEILEGIGVALAYDRSQPCSNPYGDGFSSKKILDFLKSTFSGEDRARLLQKRFIDINL